MCLLVVESLGWKSWVVVERAEVWLTLGARQIRIKTANATARANTQNGFCRDPTLRAPSLAALPYIDTSHTDCDDCFYEQIGPDKDLCFACNPGFYGISERPLGGAGYTKCVPCEKEGCATCDTPSEKAGNCSRCAPGYYRNVCACNVDFMRCCRVYGTMNEKRVCCVRISHPASCARSADPGDIGTGDFCSVKA